MNSNADLAALIRNIPDYPKPGIMFRDVSTLLLDSGGYRMTIDRLAALVDADTQLVAGIEARGFIVASALAYVLGLGQLMLRKPGKLPGDVHSESYDLEYGSTSLEMHQDAFGPGSRVIIVDDVLATGGTACAAIDLVRRTGAEIVRFAVIMDLPGLGGCNEITQLPDGQCHAALISDL